VSRFRRLREDWNANRREDGELPRFHFVRLHKPVELRVRAEVEEKSNLQVCRPKIVQELAFSGWRQDRRRLDLNNDFFVDDHVDTLSCEHLTSEPNGDRNLATNHSAACHKFALESEGVHVLQESVPQQIVNIKEGAYDGVRGFTFEQVGVNHPQILNGRRQGTVTRLSDSWSSAAFA
jgi:hypothetical protein